MFQLARWKTVSLVVLAAGGLCFLLVDPAAFGTKRPGGPVNHEGIRASVERTLREYGIPAERTKIRNIRVQGSSFTRVEQRVQVPADFASILLNHTLNSRLATLGAHVVATERIVDATVIMHIVSGGHTVFSIALVRNTDLSGATGTGQRKSSTQSSR